MTEETKKEDSLVSDLVSSVLAVQNKTLEWAFSLNEGLEREGVFRLEELGELETEEIGRRLDRAGFDRGDYFRKIFAKRLHELSKCYATVEPELRRLEEAGDAAAVEKILLGIWGVGPVVVRNYLILRGLLK